MTNSSHLDRLFLEPRHKAMAANYCEIRPLRIYEGAAQMQQLIIARGISKTHKACEGQHADAQNTATRVNACRFQLSGCQTTDGEPPMSNPRCSWRLRAR
jgi:hypothetical protein